MFSRTMKTPLIQKKPSQGSLSGKVLNMNAHRLQAGVSLITDELQKTTRLEDESRLCEATVRSPFLVFVTAFARGFAACPHSGSGQSLDLPLAEHIKIRTFTKARLSVDDAIQHDWDRVGDYISTAIVKYDSEHPLPGRRNTRRRAAAES